MTMELISDTEIRVTRTFDAPRSLVFKAHSSCEHLSKWLGPRELTMSSCEMEFRSGGAYRYVHRSPDGAEYGFRGKFIEVVPPERIVQTFEFEALAGHVSTETLVLLERDGRTYATVTSRFASKEDRDGMMAGGGFEDGMRDSYERLDELLGQLSRGEATHGSKT
jgi:uncharacterized protein YndB with AHSA1/START domain